MRNLLALLLFVPSLCLAQLPEYVSPDGLIGWFPMNGSLESGIIGIPDGQINGPTGTPDRFGVSSGALNFDGIDDEATIDHYSGFENLAELTISIWLNPSDYPSAYANCGGGYGAAYALVSKWASTIASRTFLIVLSDWGPGSTGINPDGYLQVCNNSGGVTGCFQSLSYATFPLNNWTHLAVTMGTDTTTIYVNGLSVYSGESGSTNGSLLHTSNPIFIGNEEDASATCPRFYSGQLDDLGFWNRALNQSEVESLFLSTAPIIGCTDTDACNFQPNANLDDGSCISCEVLASACGEGTVWDSTLQQCISIAPPCAPSCGEGTVWDPVNEECIIAIPADLNYDGCITVADLLELLTVHGTCPPYPEWPDFPGDTSTTGWSCGDPVTYWDYDYATVLIGDQCWFAENLRTEKYANSDSISANLTDAEWTSTTAGATAVYGEGSSVCTNYSPDINACDDAQSLLAYGRLYNWYAVDDMRGLCPPGWNVPTDGEWTNLESYITSQGFAGTEGTALKSTTGWGNSGNGTDDFGFSVFPGGYRALVGGGFYFAGENGYYWSSTPNGGYAWYWFFYGANQDVYRGFGLPRDGYSIRCIKD